MQWQAKLRDNNSPGITQQQVNDLALAVKGLWKYDKLTINRIVLYIVSTYEINNDQDIGNLAARKEYHETAIKQVETYKKEINKGAILGPLIFIGLVGILLWII
jgi:hypothetical protein